MNYFLAIQEKNITENIEMIIEKSHISETLVIDAITAFAEYLPKLFFAIVLFFICLKLINILVRSVKKIITARDVDHSVVKFIGLIISISLKLTALISLATYLGFETTSLVAMLGAAGLAIGLALQGTLQNFAGGVIILVLKPFKTGDDVEFGGERGTVKEVQLFSTIIEKFGTNEDLVIPNSTISSSALTNWNKERSRRIDITFGVGYGTNLKVAKDLIIKAANSDKRAITQELTTVFVTELADSSVNLELRVWCDPAEYLDVRSDMVELIYNTLNENNIDIPFPQLTIHKNS